MPLLSNNVNKPNYRSNQILECIILVMVILASTSIGLESELIIEEKNTEIDYIFGTVTLSTRTAMNALGLSENTDIGAVATVNLSVNSIISEGCESCEQVPSGLQIEGFVLIQNIRNEMGGLGRIEGTLSITYLKEHLNENFISKEWFTIEWNASGGTELDTFAQFTIIHNPPKLDLDNRYDASFIGNDNEKESRTGPWVFTENLIDESSNTKGCFPNSLSCEKSLNPDINLTSIKKSVELPKIIQHPNELTQINDIENTNVSPNQVNGFRKLFELKNETNNPKIWCNDNEEDIIAAKSWELVVSNNNIIAPMSLWLDILDLPSSTFMQTSGIWSEIEYNNSGCASISDWKGNLRISIILT